MLIINIVVYRAWRARLPIRDAAVRQIHGPYRTVIEFFWTVRTDLISECTLKHSIRMIFVDSFP